jgi:hypothetical protein
MKHETNAVCSTYLGRITAEAGRLGVPITGSSSAAPRQQLAAVGSSSLYYSSTTLFRKPRGGVLLRIAYIRLLCRLVRPRGCGPTQMIKVLLCCMALLLVVVVGWSDQGVVRH